VVSPFARVGLRLLRLFVLAVCACVRAALCCFRSLLGLRFAAVALLCVGVWLGFFSWVTSFPFRPTSRLLSVDFSAPFSRSYRGFRSISRLRSCSFAFIFTLKQPFFYPLKLNSSPSKAITPCRWSVSMSLHLWRNGGTMRFTARSSYGFY